ncbi:MAG: hypothetical protein MUW56_17745 [Chryseobacterium sp.]|uniref:hypothetical protein n=1 Tax=Chryseobacterium sp. TaxID=1871047 RepID=UPI0025C0ADF2|nr:hypothetical protein [Chryseobacterium sp.]MCJ7935410.1 hypothetical protein [Chryseobacterium sp.]
MKSSRRIKNICALFLIIFTAAMDAFKTFRNIPFFQELSEEEINILIRISTPKLLRRKEKLAEPGKPFTHVFILSNGLLRFFFDDENGIESSKTSFTEYKLISGNCRKQCGIY